MREVSRVERDSRIYVAGHTGLIGSALVRRLKKEGYTNLILRTRDQTDLTNKAQVEALFSETRPEYVFLAAARVGGIKANSTRPAEFIYENLMIQTNVIDLAWRYGVKRLMFFGSSCVYPKQAEQPMKEEYLMTGKIEPTNEPFGVAKLAGISMCRAYRAQYGVEFFTVIPANVYGVGDHFNEDAHVVSSLIMKFHRAKLEGHPSVTLWGTGRPRREFLYVDDLAEACLFLMNLKELPPDPINIGRGEDTSVRELAEIIKEITGFTGNIEFDTTRPDGNPRRLLDSSRMHGLGWRAKTPLEEGLKRTYRWYLECVEGQGA